MSVKKDQRRRAIGDAKAHFAECVREAEDGATTVLTRHGRPVAKIEPYAETPVLSSSASAIRESTSGYASSEVDEFRSLVAKRSSIHRLLEEEIWPRVPAIMRGKAPTKREIEELLGYGEPGEVQE